MPKHQVTNLYVPTVPAKVEFKRGVIAPTLTAAKFRALEFLRTV